MKHCSPRQEAAFHSLQTLDIFRRLEAYSPVLTGTIPLDIDIETSDLDIICCAADLEAFAHDVTTQFGNQQAFQIKQKTIRGEPCLVAKFDFQEFPIEIFAQNRPVEQQYAYRHMLIEARLLVLGGEAARQEIRRLKQNGLKTEPAFARYFHLAGDPYEVLYQLSFWDDLSIYLSPTPNPSSIKGLGADRKMNVGAGTRAVRPIPALFRAGIAPVGRLFLPLLSAPEPIQGEGMRVNS